jgi:hypothetical protein
MSLFNEVNNMKIVFTEFLPVFVIVKSFIENSF